MEKFQKFLEEKLGPVMSKLGSNRYLLAVRDGVIAALPLIIVGSFFLIIANPPPSRGLGRIPVPQGQCRNHSSPIPHDHVHHVPLCGLRNGQ